MNLPKKSIILAAFIIAVTLTSCSESETELKTEANDTVQAQNADVTETKEASEETTETTAETTAPETTTTAEEIGIVEPDISDFKYKYLDFAEGMKIEQYNGKSSYIRIPDQIEGYPVVYVDIYDNSVIKQVELPNSVHNVFFTKCTNLESITIPPSADAIDQDSFNGCTGLKEVILHDGIRTIFASAFSGCSSLENIVLPDGLTNIGAYAFSNCSSLKELTIPDGLWPIIPEGTFDGCDNLTLTFKGKTYDSTNFNELYEEYKEQY